MKSLREQIAGRCVHFNGVHNDACKAGIRYDTFTDGVPCLKFREKPCEKQEWPTEERILAELKQCDEATARMMKVTPLIIRIKKEHQNESWSGTELCPVCGGKLHMRIAGYNGHVWGQCETENCVRWME